MFLSILLLIAGLALIIYGANWLTEGGSGVAKRFGLSEMIIGLTIVAFGTSAPELVISVLSAVDGKAGLAIGNVVGSNIANVLLIIGAVAMLRPIKVEKSVMTNEIPLVILSSVALLACGNSSLLDGTQSNTVTRVDGILLLLFFCIFMRYTFAQAKKLPAIPGDVETAVAATQEVQHAEKKAPSMLKSIILIAVGLAGLIFGGQLFVDSATDLATEFGVSQAIIGLTIVAVGTSLPELATSVVSAIKGHPGLAVGNVIGSCIFNILFVLGLSATIQPLPLGDIGNFDLLTMTGAAVLFWLTGWLIGKHTITRGEGIFMLLCYLAYTIVLIINA